MENRKSDIHRKGIGSFFSSLKKNTNYEDKKTSFYPKNNKIFYNGRQAIKYVIECIKLENKIGIIWIPEYYCKHVSDWLKSCYSNVKTYDIDPFNPSTTIQADNFVQNGDVIIVQNFWGINECNINTGNKYIYVVEDHSHGWLSDSCTNSNADYCIASLRKSLPIPLGGIAWKPNEEILNSNIKLSSSKSIDKIWEDIEEAMTLKEIYESDNQKDESFKIKSRELIFKTEKEMHVNYNLTFLNKNYKSYIENHLSTDYLSFKSKNFNYIRDLLKPSNQYEILQFNEQIFGLILYLKSKKHMQKLKLYLISKGIYPSLLWPDNNPKYGYFLNIHIDFRYNTNEMDYIARYLNFYNKNFN